MYLKGMSLPAVGGLVLDGPGVPEHQSKGIFVCGLRVPYFNQFPAVLSPHLQHHISLLVGRLERERGVGRKGR